MSSVWINHAQHLKELIDNHQTQAHLFLEQLMLLPVDIQDVIIEEISHLQTCNVEAITSVINNRLKMELK